MTFVACRYGRTPAVLDTTTRVYYFCKTMQRARTLAKELNDGA